RQRRAEFAPGQLLPETMNAFKLSGENAAAEAPSIKNGAAVWLVVSKMMTWFGVSVVSETTTNLPSGETANTAPKALVKRETDVPLKTISPFCPKFEESTPR